MNTRTSTTTNIANFNISASANIGPGGASQAVNRNHTQTETKDKDKDKMEPRYILLTNLHLVLPDGTLSPLTTLHIDIATGLLIPSPDGTFTLNTGTEEETRTIDMNGRWVSPGLMDIQINGAFGVDLSDFKGEEKYVRDVRSMGQGLCRIGVTSFVPTIISQKAEAYHSILPVLSRLACPASAESEDLDAQSDWNAGSAAPSATPLGWHVEGPFLSPKKKGCHPPENLASADGGLGAIEQIYGSESMAYEDIVKIITLAPDVVGVPEAIPRLVEKGWTVSLGHTNATTAQALAGVEGGATLLTHLFNAMPALHHREPGIIGLLGLPPVSVPPTGPSARPSMAQRVVSSAPTPTSRSVAVGRVPSPIHEYEERDAVADQTDETVADTQEGCQHPIKEQNTSRDTAELNNDCSKPKGGGILVTQGSHDVQQCRPLTVTAEDPREEKTVKRPFFSIIADGIHVHPQAVCMAYNAHPEGCILVSDAMHMLDPGLADGLHPWRDGMIEKKDGGIVLAGTDTLAGSILPLPEAVRNLSLFTGISIPQAIVCATYSPAKCLGRRTEAKVGFEVGCWADLVVWDPEGRVEAIWKGGKEVVL